MSRIPYFIYLIARFFFLKKVPFLPFLFMVINRLMFGVYIPSSCKLGTGTRFAYGGSGVVIHSSVVIGVNCIIGTGVTIGGRGKHSKDRNGPVIGDNVYIATGAKVLGPVTVGNNAVIGANAVVIKDVPDNAVVAGVPAKIIGENKSISDYY